MSIKKQFVTLKKNWLMVVLGLVVLIFLSGGGIVRDSFDGVSSSFDKGYGGVGESLNYYPESDSGFVPEVEERKVVKSSSLSSEVERGEFGEAEERLKNIVSSSGAYLLSERVNKDGEGWGGYFSGYYSLKVESSKYETTVAQLKEIGEVQSFNENMADVTGRYDDVEIELGVERTRLVRYLEMYGEAEDVGDKIDLNDRIFDQERRVKYLEDSLARIDERVEYSSISFSMVEERCEWADIVFVKLSDLVRGFVGSLNSLLSFIFSVVPWVLAGFVGWFFWKRFRK